MINHRAYQNQQWQLKLSYIRNRNVVQFPTIRIVILLYCSLLKLARQTPDIGKHLQWGHMRHNLSMGA